MASYDDGKELEDRGATEDDLAYKADYEEHQDVIELLDKCQQADKDNRERVREAHLFLDKRDGQWEPYWWNSNEAKPRYTFDMVNPIVDQVASEIEQSDYDIRVSPAGGDATKDLAIAYDGIIRNIEQMSNAKTTYAQCARNMVIGGMDGWRVVQKYVDDNSFDQDLAIEHVGNFVDRVWFDPAAENQDKSDSRYAFVLHAMAKDEYEARFPEGSGESVDDDREGEAYYDKAECIVVGEFLYLESEDRELVMMSNGQVHEVNEDFDKVVDDLAAIGVTEAKRRTRKKHYVCSRFFDAKDFLEDKKETVFCRIPVVPAYANFKIFENKTIYWGVVEKLLDPQRVMNYSVSREIEEGALAPRAKYWMTMAQASGHEKQLQTLNTNADPVQFYNVDPESPAVPQQQGGSQVNPGLARISESMRAIIGQTAGMFAANMGDNPGLQSGVAIKQLQDRGTNSTMKYSRGLEIAVAATGRLLKDAIPMVYDTERQVRILREDESYDMVPINQKVIDNATGEIVTVNDLQVGTYDVTCRAGPSFRNRQQETIEAITTLAQTDPSLMQIAGDLLLQNISTPAASQIAERKRIQMIAQGLIPQSQMTEEELQEMAAKMQAQGQQQAPDPAMVLAQAEQMKAQADMMKAQIDAQKVQNDTLRIQLQAQNDQNELVAEQAKTQVDVFNAQTNRIKAQVEAEKAGATIDHTNIKAFGDQLDNQEQMTDMMDEQERKARMAMMSDVDLMRIANSG
ncbi:MAG: hypothetical protein CMP84_16000 [Gammaproteobacteria bacterium]|nr:hypothetical protein [Gammaproteobacteria bacterium]MAC71690.1 hypothetical protein [Gammaproteobacteria bacterium]|tara:strand:- start:4460 stop:6682 length:2223 start_codon:yes stop_codon:yes gene_type:complete